MILAAGRGERMRPLTDTLPKPLLSVRGKPLIEYHLCGLQQSGVEQVVINHAWLGHKIEQYLGDGQRFGLRIQYSAEPQALETAGGIVNAMPLLLRADASEILVVNGDIFCDFDYRDLAPMETQTLAHLVMVNNPEHHPDGDFALDQNKLTLHGESKLTFSGIGLYRPAFFDGLSAQRYPMRPLFERFIAEGRVTAQLHPGQWTDVGTPQRLAQLNQSEVHQ